MRVLDEGDDSHLRFTLAFDPSSGRGWALEGIHLVDSLHARGPSTPTEVTPVIAFWFFGGERRELRAFASAPTGVSSIVPGQRLVGFRNVNRERRQKIQSVKLMCRAVLDGVGNDVLLYGELLKR